MTFNSIMLRPAQDDLILALVEQDERKPHEQRYGYFFLPSWGQPMGRIHRTDPQLRAHGGDLIALADVGLIRVMQFRSSGSIEQFVVTGAGEQYVRWHREQRGQTATLRDLEEVGQVHDVPELMRHVARIRVSVYSDPAQAIGSSKELLETVCLAILDRHGMGNKDDLPALVKQVRKQLNLEGGRTGDARDRVLNGLTEIANGVAELRNLSGTGHGRSKAPTPDPAYARLVVDSTSTIALFLLNMWDRQRNDET